MDTKYDRFMLATYLQNLIAGASHKSILAQNIVEWARYHGDDLGISSDLFDADDSDLDLAQNPPKRRRRHRRQISDISRESWRLFMQIISDVRRSLSRCRPTLAYRNIEDLAHMFHLDRIEHGLLDIVVRNKLSRSFDNLTDDIMNDGKVDADTLARLLNTRADAISRRLNPNSKLISSGLITIEANQALNMGLEMSDRILNSITPPVKGIEQIKNTLLGQSLQSDLEWEDYQHIGREADFIFDLLQGALRKRSRGINILVYGPSGTGKTEFCKVLANRLQATLYSLAEQDEYGGEPIRRERVDEIRLAQNLLQNDPNTLLLFDEMEDLIGAGRSNWFIRIVTRHEQGSKVFINRLLESNATPILWTSNDTEAFDPAVIRRMTFALELRTPPLSARKHVWTRVSKKANIRLETKYLTDFARMEAPPALASTAIKAIRLARGQHDDIPLVIDNVTRAMNGGRQKPLEHVIPDSFDIHITNAKTDIVELTTSLAGRGIQRFSLCLYGPAGTGKSLYIRHLASSLGMEILFKRASDLLSMWVGGTEKNIADAFREARANKSFLIIDEADSLLRERSSANQSWEVTQVNEMLTWMEVHDLPFACTTNLMESLDKASLRRFTFKIEFTYMTPQQIHRAFELFFSQIAPQKALTIDRLTPGDFAVVNRKADVLGISDPHMLANMLSEECNNKPDLARPIGFNA